MTGAANSGPNRTGVVVSRRLLVLVMLTGLAYYASARLGYTLTMQPAGVYVWPPAGVLVAVLLLRPRREWLFLCLGAVTGGVSADLGHYSRFGSALANSVVSILGSLAVAWVVRALAGRVVTLRSLRELMALLVGGVLVTNALTSLAGSLLLAAGREVDPLAGWFTWWAGDGLGILLVTPLLLVWGQGGAIRLDRRRAVEAVVPLLLLAAAAYFVIAPEPDQPELIEVARYSVFPMLFLISVRYGIRGATFALLVVSAVMMWKGSQSTGIFTRPGEPASQQLLEVYGYLALVGISALVPAAILHERGIARRQLRESESRFREMAEHIQEAFFVVDQPSGEPRYVSPHWSVIWGRPIEDGYDPTLWYQALHPDDQPGMAAALADSRTGMALEHNFRVIRPNGEIRWVRSRAFPVKDTAGEVIRIVGVARDVTNQRLAEERQGRSERMESLGRLAGGVAHDFNNVLGVVLADTELLEDAVTDPGQREMVEEIRDAAQRGAQLTRQLLAFSRQQSVTPTVFDLATMAASMRGLLERLGRANIHLEVDCAPGACLVRADQGQLEHVLVNLVENARDAMPHGGSLTIATQAVEVDTPRPAVRGEIPAGRYAVMSVTDTGSGISDEVRAKMFEPFYTTKSPTEGTGLGLSTAEGIITKAHGFLIVDTTLGVGSRFSVFLPSVEGEAPQWGDVVVDAGSSPA